MAKFTTDTTYNKGIVRVRDFNVTVDEPVSNGGTDGSPHPSEYLLVALSSCMGITMKMYADRKQWDTGLITVECIQKVDEHGEKYIEKHITFEKELSEDDKKRLIFIGNKCPVSKSLSVKMLTVGM